MDDRRWRRPAVTVPATVGLLAAVALGVGRHSWSDSSAGTRNLPSAFWDWVWTTVFVLWLAAVVLALREAHRKRRGQGTVMRPVSWRKAALVFGAILLALLLVARVRHLQLSPRNPALTIPTLPATQTAPTTAEPRRGREESHFRWEAAAITAGVLALLAGGYLLAKRRRRRVRPDRAEATAALLEILDDTLDDLRREPDPRKAVIAAYARMERSLAAAGLPRHASEAPDEYLARVLAELDASAPSAERLTALFARAKFSPHTIDLRMKDEAIDALVALRTELAT